MVLDECVPEPLRKHVVGHEVFTVSYLGLKGLKNGRLLARLEADGFGGLVTIDLGFATEQNLGMLPVAVVLVDIGSDDLDDLIAVAPKISAALTAVRKGEFVRVTRDS